MKSHTHYLWFETEKRHCTAIIEAELSAAGRRPDAAAKLRMLDSLMQTGPRAMTWLLAAANLSVARLVGALTRPCQ